MICMAKVYGYQLYSEMTQNNLHIPVDNAEIDIMSILRTCKQIIISSQKS